MRAGRYFATVVATTALAACGGDVRSTTGTTDVGTDAGSTGESDDTDGYVHSIPLIAPSVDCRDPSAPSPCFSIAGYRSGVTLDTWCTSSTSPHEETGTPTPLWKLVCDDGTLSFLLILPQMSAGALLEATLLPGPDQVKTVTQIAIVDLAPAADGGLLRGNWLQDTNFEHLDVTANAAPLPDRPGVRVTGTFYGRWTAPGDACAGRCRDALVDGTFLVDELTLRTP